MQDLSLTWRRLWDTCTSSLQVTPNWRGGSWCPEGRAAVQRALQEQSQRNSVGTVARSAPGPSQGWDGGQALPGREQLWDNGPGNASGW